MSARYLEFDSSYRDRTLYSQPANFVVELSQSGQGSKLTAKDPVSDASPILIWNNSFVETPGTAARYIAAITTSPGPSPGTQNNNVFQISTSSTNYLRQVRNFYVGASLAIGANSSYPPTTPITSRRIIDYQPINLNNALVTLDSALPDSVVGTTGFYIANPTPLATNTASTLIRTFVPGSNQCISTTQRSQNYGLGGDNYYINFLIMNTNTGDAYTITGFDAVTRLATIDGTPSTDWSAMSAGSSVNFVIRKKLPAEYSFAAGLPVMYGTANAVQLQSITNNPPTDTYNGDFIRISPPLGAPAPYNLTTNPPYDATVVAISPTNCQTQERRIKRYVYATGTITSISGLTVGLGTSASSVDDFYTGTIISDTTAAALPVPDFAVPSSIITAYNGTTKVATLQNALTGSIVGDTWYIRTCVLSSPFVPSPVRGNLYELELFTRDNSNPFNYTGSLVSSQENVCYEVELLNLILPNITLASGRGGRPVFYPYLYVELHQLSTSASANRGIIYSNNPNSFRMLFRAVVDDTTAPASSPFIKIDGDGMVHAIKFKPNEDFRFAVYHANGDLFNTSLDEQYSPSIPNALVQISACFAFKRV